MTYLKNYKNAKLKGIDIQKAYIAGRVLDTQIEFDKEEFELVCEVAELCWIEFNLDPYDTTQRIQEILEYGYNWLYEKQILSHLTVYRQAKVYIKEYRDLDFDELVDEIPMPLF